MKKSMIFAAFAAALTLSSCIKEVKDEAPVALRTVQFNALPSDTKTVFGDKSEGKYPVLWQEGDKINYTFNFGTIPTTGITVIPSSDGTSASFSGKFAESDSYQFIFVSPSEAFKSRNKDEGTIMVEFPNGQASTASSPDPSAQILYANTGVMTEISNPVDLNFSHLSAYLHMRFINVALGDAVVQAVNVTSEDHNIAGRLFYKFNEDIFTEGTSSLFHTIAIETTTLDDVWCALRPVDFSGKKLTLVVATDKGTFTKEVNLPASANLVRGRIAKFTVDMSGIALEAPVVYKVVTSADQLHVGDKVIIAAADVAQSVAMSTGQNGNNRSQAGVNKTAEEIVNPTDAVEIIELEDGLIPGHYALKATGTAGYLYAASLDGAANYLRTQDDLTISASWNIEIKDVDINGTLTEKAAVIVSDAPAPASNVIRHNPGSVLFSAYQPDSKQQAVKLYRLDVPASTTPRFNATLPNGNEISSSAQDVPVYIFSNVPWTASVTGDATLDVNSGSGPAILTLSIPQNPDAVNSRDITVTVSTTASVTPNSYELVITQAAQPIPAVFPIIWSMPAISDSWQNGVDFNCSSYKTPWIYSDDHSGKLTLNRFGTNPSNAPNYKYFNPTQSGEPILGGRMYTQGLTEGDYWLFDVYQVQNPAGTYTISYTTCSTNAAPRVFLLQYSIDDGATWVNINATTSALELKSGASYNGGKEYTYTYTTSTAPNFTNNELKNVNESFHIDAIPTMITLKIRAVVACKMKNDGSGDVASDHNGGAHRLGANVTINFIED